jgi:hypothetical protein
MENSFVSRMYRESKHTPFEAKQERAAILPASSSWPAVCDRFKLYRRGPDAFALPAKVVEPAGVATLVSHLWNGGDQQIFMAGYSRGGAIVIHTAALLKSMKTKDGKPIQVEALFLFDAVDRAVQLNAKTIPSNVRNCYHAMRDRRTMSRETFGNCGLSAESSKTNLVKRNDFYTTHAGMGGVLWGEKGLPVLKYAGDPFRSDDPPVRWSSPAERLAQGFIDEGFGDGPTKVTVAQESQGMLEVQAWMWPFFQGHQAGIPRHAPPDFRHA